MLKIIFICDMKKRIESMRHGMMEWNKFKENIL